MSYGYVDGTAMFTRLREGEEDMGYKDAGAGFGGWYVMNVVVSQDVIDQMERNNIIQAEFAKPFDDGFLVKFKRKKPAGVPKTFHLERETEGGIMLDLSASDLKEDVDDAEPDVPVWSGDKVRVYFGINKTGKTNRRGEVLSATLVGVLVTERGERKSSTDDMPF